MLSRLAFTSGKEVSSLWTKKTLSRCLSQAVAVQESDKVVLPKEINDRLMKYPARLENYEDFKMPGAPYEGMGPLPPVPDYEDVKKELKFYFIPKYWFDFFYEKTGVTGPYVFAGALFTFLASKEFYMFGHNYGHHSRQIFWSAVTIAYFNSKYGEMLRDMIEDWRTERYIAMDAIKEEEVKNCYEVIEEINLAKWRAGLSEFYNEAKQANLQLMLETAFFERQAAVVNRIKQKLDYQIAVQKVDNELAQSHMVNWIEGKVLESISQDTQSETLDACIAELHVMAEKESS